MGLKQVTITILEIFLIVIIPSLTIGFDYFENSKLYNQVFGFSNIEKVMIEEFTKSHLNSDRKLISREDKEFNYAWKLIKSDTLVKLPNKLPKYIVRLGVKNAPYTPYINNTQFILIPESVPIVVGYCDETEPFSPKCSWNDTIIVGTVEDFKNWISKKERNIRIKTNLFLSLLSIIMGSYIHVLSRKSTKNKTK